MTWEKTIKKYKPMSSERNLTGKGLDNPNLKQRSREALYAQEGGYNKPPQKATFSGDCKVRKCDAIKCANNSDGKCTLNEVTIDNKGNCNMFRQIPAFNEKHWDDNLEQ